MSRWSGRCQRIERRTNLPQVHPVRIYGWTILIGRLRFVAAALMLVAIFAGCAARPAADAAAGGASGGFSAATSDSLPSADWSQDIARFADLDAASPPPLHPIVFTGSSSIRMWPSLAADFPGRAVLNRGFGGSQVRDATWFAEELVVRYRPRQVVVYAGDNDIDAGRSPEQVLADFHALVARLRRDLPDVPIVWISIKPSVARAAQMGAQRKANTLVREAAADMTQVDFVDVFTPMLDENGAPRVDLFIDDGLHLNEAGYALWRRIVAPYLM